MAILGLIRTRTSCVSTFAARPQRRLQQHDSNDGKADTFAARMTFKDNCFYTVQQTISAVLQLPGASLTRVSRIATDQFSGRLSTAYSLNVLSGPSKLYRRNAQRSQPQDHALLRRRHPSRTELSTRHHFPCSSRSKGQRRSFPRKPSRYQEEARHDQTCRHYRDRTATGWLQKYIDHHVRSY